MTLPFLILAVLTLAGALTAIVLRRLVHCVLALTLAFAGLAGLYIELGAQFVGLAQILVYIGAVAILIVFAILLTRGGDPPPVVSLSRRSSWLAGGAVAAAVFATLAWAVTAGVTIPRGPVAQPQVTMKQIGDALMQRFILPLEVVGLMLTAALIGAVILAMQEKLVMQEKQNTQ